METLIRLTVTYAQWIYAICGFAALFNVYRTWQIRGERRQAVFTLERQKAADDLYKILFTALILLAVMGTTYFLSDVVAESMGIAPPSRSLAQDLGIISLPGSTGGAESIADGDGETAGEQAGSAEDGSSDGNSDASDTTTTNETSSADAGNATSDQESSSDSATQNDSASAATEDALNTGQETGTAAADNAASTETANASAADSSTQADVSGSSNNSAISVVPTVAPPQPTPTFTYAPPAPAPPTSPPPAPPTIVPTAAPVITAPPCPDPRSKIVVPGNGAVVNSSFNIVGTATHEQFQFYKLEYAPGTDPNQPFVYLAGGSDPISGGILGTADSTNWANGVWTIRIVVVDQTGNFPPPCNVTVTVNN